MRALLAVAAALAVLVAAVLVAMAMARDGSEASESAAGALRRTLVFRGFESPVFLVQAPGDATGFYVVEQPGRILRVVRSGQRRTFLDIRQNVDYGGERGLLGLAFDPGYAKNRLLYVAYTSTGGQNVVARYRARGLTALRSSRKLLLAVDDPYANHNGGNLAFGPDGLLYTSIGDGGSGGDPENRSQDMQSVFGKLLRLDVSKPRAQWEIAALGLRNPWRFSFDRATGDLYIGDVGQNAVEEVDFLPRSRLGELQNYGWNKFEGSQRFQQGVLGPGRVVSPVFEYGHAGGNCSITGGYVYRGRGRNVERGRYVLGDYCSGVVRSFRVVGGKATGVRVAGFRIQGLTSFGQDAAGELYALSESGNVFRLS